jgi:lipopolysaccharide export LptBFGC system permease protein LptF
MKVVASKPILNVFGIVTRTTLNLYFRATVLMMLIFLVTALAIDLATNFSDISRRSNQSGANTPYVWAPYLLYRSVDIVTRLLPQACFFGVFLAEIIRVRRFESNILYFAGVSPAYSLIAVVWFSALFGAVQTINEGWARPAAVFAQIELGVGAYGIRFGRGLRNNPDWFLRNDTLIRAFVRRGEPTELRDVEIFKGIGQKQLTSVTLAKRAIPTSKLNVWRLNDVIIWNLDSKTNEYTPTFQSSLDLDLDIDATRIKYWGIAGYYLRWRDLNKIASIPSNLRSSDPDVAIWRRWSAVFLPGVFAFLGASLAPLGFQAGRANIPFLVVLAVFGYLAIVSVKVFWALGELGTLSPAIAVLSPVIFAALIAALALLKQMVRKWPAFHFVRA